MSLRGLGSGLASGLEAAGDLLRSRHVLALSLALAVPAALLRALSLFFYFSVFHSDAAAWAGLLRGAASDLVSSYLAALAFGWTLAARRSVYVACALVSSVLYAGNLEHIGQNGSNFSALLVGYAVAPEFISGNVLVRRVFLSSLVAFLATLAVLAWTRKRHLLAERPVAFFAGLGCLSAALWIPVNLRYSDWLQENLLETNAKLLFAHSGRRHKASTSLDARTRRLDAALKRNYLSQDLDGERRFEPRRGKPNILLVLVESLGERYVSEQTMPFLAGLGNEHLRFTSFFAHQHLTVKGLYSLLSGEYPNLKYTDCKSDIIGTFGAARSLLPKLLRREGYSTVFLQAAPLGFMRKDLFADRAGFERIHGAADFETAHRSGPWGVDDRTLFERALVEARRLSRPWMMTLLTSGTHSPYNVPAGFRGKDGDFTLEDALLYTDTYLKELVDGLGEMGVLDDTLVVVTSDEVKGEFPQGTAGAIEWYRSPLIIRTPEGYRETIEARYGHIDFTLSVLDYLGMAAIPEEIGGRSLFRRYSSPRNLLLGRETGIILLNEADKVHFLSRSFDRIQSYAATERGYEAIAPAEDLAAEVRQVVEYSDVVFSEVDSEYLFRERKRYLTGNATVAGQLSFSATKGEKLVWEIRLNTSDIDRGLVKVKMEVGVPNDQGSYQVIFADSFTVNPGSEIFFSRALEVPWDIERLDSFIFVQVPRGEKAFLDHVYIRRDRR